MSNIIHKDKYEVSGSEMAYTIPIFNHKNEFKFHLECSEKLYKLYHNYE